MSTMGGSSSNKGRSGTSPGGTSTSPGGTSGTSFKEETSGAQWSSATKGSPGYRAEEHQEGDVAMAIEEKTARLPSDWFLWGALGAMGLSAILQVSGAKDRSNFVGQWVPTLLIFGLYNKIVKVAGSDQLHR